MRKMRIEKFTGHNGEQILGEVIHQNSNNKFVIRCTLDGYKIYLVDSYSNHLIAEGRRLINLLWKNYQFFKNKGDVERTLEYGGLLRLAQRYR